MFVIPGMHLPMIALAVSLQLALSKAAPMPPATWRQCGDQAFLSHQFFFILLPPVRHGYARNPKEVDGVIDAKLAQWDLFPTNHQDILSTHIATIRSRVADLAASACPGAHQPTLFFTTIGGFGDRLRGMVTTYYVALLTHAQYRVCPRQYLLRLLPTLMSTRRCCGKKTRPDRLITITQTISRLRRT
jgi:hypothetical protein